MKQLKYRIIAGASAALMMGLSITDLPQNAFPKQEITASAAEAPFFNSIEAFRTYIDANFYTKYVADDTGTKYTIYGYRGSDPDVYIPNPVIVQDENSNYKVVTVEAIAEGAFEGNDKITSLSIASSVEKIGSSAFRDCTALQYLQYTANDEETGTLGFKLSDGLRTLGSCAFTPFQLTFSMGL